MQSHAEAVTEAGEADATVGLYQDVTCLDVTAQSIAWHHISFNCHLYVHFQFKQEGQHPLTGQRAANFRLLANQWAERRLVTQWRHGCRTMRQSACNAGASNAGRSRCIQISRERNYPLTIYWYHSKGNWLRYNDAAESFYIMKLFSRLFVLYCRNCPKDHKFKYFIPIFKKLGAA